MAWRAVAMGQIAIAQRPSRTLNNLVDVLYDGLTPTLYAAPTAQGSGDGSSEANAAELQALLTTAPAGSIIGGVPGVYSQATATGDHWRPVYFMESSGSSGAPTIFVGKYDHLLYWNDPAKRCEFRNATADNTAPWNGAGNYPVIGCYSRDYQQWRNVYINTQYAPPYPSRGTVDCNDANHILFRKIVFERTVTFNGSEGGADNYDCLFQQGSTDVTTEYVYAFGNAGTSVHRNMAVIKLYSVTSFAIRNCTFSGVMMGVFVKGDVLTSGNSGRISNIKSTGALWGAVGVGVVRPVAGGANTVEVDHILSIRDAETLRYESSGDNGSTNDHRNFHHITSVDCTGVSSGGAIYSNDATLLADIFKDSVVAFTAPTSTLAVQFDSGVASDMTALDYNQYYESGGSAQFAMSGSVRTGLAAWQAATSAEAHSTEGDPLFDNVGADNYKRTSSGDVGSSTGGKRGCYETGSEVIGTGVQ